MSALRPEDGSGRSTVGVFASAACDLASQPASPEPTRRVVHVVPGPARHGVTRHALEIVTALQAGARPGAEVRHELLRILTGGDGGEDGGTGAGAGADLRHGDGSDHGDDLDLGLDLAATAALAALPNDPDTVLHLHLTDHLLGTSATRCADLVEALARRRPVSLTLHDLPQPEPGDDAASTTGRYARRRRAYARMAAQARGVVVASDHERALLTRALAAEGLCAGGPIEVIPLPIAGPIPSHRPASPTGSPAAEAPTAARDDGRGDQPRDLVVFGYLYPGKGHAAALEALAALDVPAASAALADLSDASGVPDVFDGAAGADRSAAGGSTIAPTPEPRQRFADVGLLALGEPSPGHDDLVAQYAARARELGRRFVVTGYLPEAEVLHRLRAAAVPVAAADHISASGSIGSWLAAGRRPLVPAGPYADELDARCPGALLRYGAGLDHATLAEAVRAALEDPTLTWLAEDVLLGPDLASCATRLHRFLCGSAAGTAPPHPAEPSDTSDPATPVVSVVVVHYDDQPGLDRVLAALGRSSDAPRQVVVADDGSPRPPVLGARSYDVRLVRQEDRGFRAAAARNLGARAVTGDVIVFLDGDTVPEPGFVAALARAMVQAARRCPTGRALAVGRRRYADFSGLDTDAAVDLVERLSRCPEALTATDIAGDIAGDIAAGCPSARVLPDATWLEEGYAATDGLRNVDDRSYRFVISAVLAMTRELFDAVGGFDESFVGYGGEDWDLANRCYLAGAEFAYAPAAVAWHDGPHAGHRPVPASHDLDGLGADDALEALGATAKSRETLRLAQVITEPGARDSGLVWEIPDIAVTVDDRGWTVEDTLLTCADLVRGSDARVWLRNGRTVAEGVWPPTDPRVHVGPVPERVLARARYRVDVTRPVRLTIPLGALCAGGPADHPGLTVRRTRDLARGAAAGHADPAVRATYGAPVTQTRGDRHLEAEWGWRRPKDIR